MDNDAKLKIAAAERRAQEWCEKAQEAAAEARRLQSRVEALEAELAKQKAPPAGG